METKPVAPLNKNLNSVKKQSPLANSSNRSSPEADRKRPKSDTSRLSRNVSKEIKTEEEEESSHSEASIGNFTNFFRLLIFREIDYTTQNVNLLLDSMEERLIAAKAK